MDADIIALQEANLVNEYSKRIALDLGYDQIHQTANVGIKLFGVGIPVNVNKGLVILAKKNTTFKK